MKETDIISALQRIGASVHFEPPFERRGLHIVEVYLHHAHQRSKATHSGEEWARYTALCTCAREFGVDVGESLV